MTGRERPRSRGAFAFPGLASGAQAPDLALERGHARFEHPQPGRAGRPVLEEVADGDPVERREAQELLVLGLALALLPHRDRRQALVEHLGDLRLTQTGALTVLSQPQPDLPPDTCALGLVAGSKLARHGLELMHPHGQPTIRPALSAF